MKIKPFLLVGIIALSGCTLTPTYDNNEYELLARLETSIRLIQEDCGVREKVVQRLPVVVSDAELLHTYTFYIPKNTEVFEIATILRDDIRQFESHYEKGTDSPIYCKLKTKTFLEKVRLSLEAVAQKKR